MASAKVAIQPCNHVLGGDVYNHVLRASFCPDKKDAIVFPPLSLPVPAGYFCVFKEIADIIVHLGQAGLTIDSSFVPDISVGILWGKYWEAESLDQKYGKRIKFEHNYPDYFPQAKSNPQLPWAYPEAALGEFRPWLREVYIQAGKFEKYLNDQVKKKALPPSFAQLAIAAYAETGGTKRLPA